MYKLYPFYMQILELSRTFQLVKMFMHVGKMIGIRITVEVF